MKNAIIINGITHELVKSNEKSHIEDCNKCSLSNICRDISSNVELCGGIYQIDGHYFKIK